MAIKPQSETIKELLAENYELKISLQEAEQAIEAIRSGGVDALVVSGDQAEDQIYTLSGAETPYRAFVEQMQEGAVSMSLDGTILYCNRRFAEMVDLPLERVIGCKFADFATNVEAAAKLICDAQIGLCRGELILSRIGNFGSPVFAAMQRLTDSTEICMVVTDLTDIVAARLLVGELEMRVDERTSALVEKNQELEGFTYSVAHDMRTPLRAIVGSANIVLEEEGGLLSEKGKHQLKRLAQAALKMAQLVDDLLQYARLGDRELLMEDVNLSDLVKMVADEVIHRHGSCELKVSIAPDLVVKGDPRFLGMALQNLFDNACKYRKPGASTLMEVGSEQRFGETVFFVKDNGIGFDMKYLHKLFIPFERLHRDAEYPGTGIGLANVKRVVERHKGTLWAEGVPGEGASFFFTLPQQR